MNIEPNCIISAESYEKFGLNHQRRDTNQSVQDFIDHDHGLMSKGIGEDEPPGENIRQVFCQLRGPETGYLSRNKFKHLFERILPTPSSGVEVLLFDIFSWHAFFPFPPTCTTSGEFCIDEDAFTRAVCQLVWTYSPHHSAHMREGRAPTTVLSPEIGGHISAGSFQPADEPYSGDDSEDEDLQQVVIVEKESERTIDIQDVISECPPDHHTMVGDPLREGYKLALPFLPHRPYDLTDLHVPTIKVLSLFPLLYAEDDSDEENELVSEEDNEPDIGADFITSIERLGTEELSWEIFNTMLNEHAEVIVDTLARIFSILKAPLDGPIV
ncbi:hypothetical protein F4813DRAFT_386871 [Daldinia decipiens]|uniref:uncharacterized protein n=1 Tax=Daldinia decipiens TaxID=326647 RepID=UPI0020C40C93|nr:uncharacterized protein F4813DRAFT_386871 [Daldinia decipiens]KAI1660001.1 hypothetical protein F4813DRAFT_386871 [Daldinia decipiens]